MPFFCWVQGLAPLVPEHVLLFEVVDAQSTQLPLEQLRTLHLHQRVLDDGVDLLHAPRSGALLF